MRTLRGPLLALAVLCAPSTAPATSPAPGAPEASAPVAPAPVVRVFEIKHADLQDVSVILPTLLSDSNVLTVDRASHTVTVVDEPEFVQRVADWLAQFDVPPHAVLVRIVLEKAERAPGAAPDEPPGAGWTYRELGDTTLEVLERGTATQEFGADGAFEIHVRLGSVDMQRRTMRFDEVAVRRRDPGAAPGQLPREVFSTAVDARDRVGKVIMAQRDAASDEKLVLRMLALVREPDAGTAPAGGR